MRLKSFIISLLVLIILSGIILIEKSMKPKVPTAEQLAKVFSQSFNKTNITECLITIGGSKVILTKKGHSTNPANGEKNSWVPARWVVENYFGAPADDNKVESLINKIAELAGELRSNDKDILSDYGITDKEGVHIQLKNGPSFVANIIIGTKRAGVGNNFVREEGANAVYAVDTDLLDYLGFAMDVKEDGLKADKWADKGLLDILETNVKSVELEKDKKIFLDLVKETKDKKILWKTVKEYPLKFDQNKITKFLRTMTSLKAGSLVAPEEDGGFSSSGWKMRIGMDNGKSVEIIRGKKDNRDYYVKVSDKKYFFRVPEYVLRALEKTDGDFFVNDPLEVKENDIKGIIISDADDKKTINIKRSEKANEKKGQNNNTPAIWLSDSGDVFMAQDVSRLLSKLRSISIKTIPEKTESVENSVLIKIIRKDGIVSEYQITKSVTLDNGREGSYFIIAKDSNNYSVDSYFVKSLKDAIVKLDEDAVRKTVKTSEQVPPKAPVKTSEKATDEETAAKSAK